MDEFYVFKHTNSADFKNITSKVEEISANEEIKNENKLQMLDKSSQSETQTADFEDLNVLQNKINPSDKSKWISI